MSRPHRAARIARRRSRPRTGRRECRRGFRAGGRRAADRATAAATRPRARSDARTRRRSAAATRARHVRPPVARRPHPRARLMLPAADGERAPNGPPLPFRTSRCDGGDARRRSACARPKAPAARATRRSCPSSPGRASPVRPAPLRPGSAAGRCRPRARRRTRRHARECDRERAAPGGRAGRPPPGSTASPTARRDGARSA